MKERDLQRQVIDLAHALGWQVCHFRTARMLSGTWATPVHAEGAGWPDLFMVHPGQQRAVAAELKSERGRLSEDQIKWIANLRLCHVEAYVWRPDDAEQIMHILSKGGET